MVARCCSCSSLLLLPKCCHMQKCSAEILVIWIFAILSDTLTSKMGVSYLGGR